MSWLNATRICSAGSIGKLKSPHSIPLIECIVCIFTGPLCEQGRRIHRLFLIDQICIHPTPCFRINDRKRLFQRMIFHYNLSYIRNLGRITCCRKIIRVGRKYIHQVPVRRQASIVNTQILHDFGPPVCIGTRCNRTHKTWFQILPIQPIHILHGTINSIRNYFHGIYILGDLHWSGMAMIRFVVHGVHGYIPCLSRIKS